MPMRLVVDTNVLVSALLNPGRVPDQCVSAICARGEAVLYDDRIVAEYRAVLCRPKFPSITPARVDALLVALLRHGERLDAVPVSDVALIDVDDRVFVDVALAGGADAIVTGNAKHYPDTIGVPVLGPAALLARYADAP